MRRPPSAYAKAATGGVLAALAALGAGLVDGRMTVGEWLMFAGAFITGALGVGATRNTEVVTTGDEQGPVTLGKVLGESGEVVGEVVATTGAAAGGIVAGTTGVVGTVLDATLGKIIPGGA